MLEVDADGKLNGGEWIGSSKKDHPDFLWLPTGRHSSTVAGGAIRYDQVKALLDASIAGPDGGNGDETEVVESGDVTRGGWKHFGPFETEGDISVVMTGTGDADLYVRRGAQPTDATYDCRPTRAVRRRPATRAGQGATSSRCAATRTPRSP